MIVWTIAVLLLVHVDHVTSDSFNVDFENTGVCTMTEFVNVRSVDIYNIYAQPPQDFKGTRDRCTVKFRGEGGRKLKLYIHELAFQECQVFVKIYDGDMHLNTARFQYGCQDGAGVGMTSYNSEVAVSLEKPDAATTAYKFYMRLATEDGPDITDYTQRSGVDPDTMSGGMIAGIVVGGVLVFVVIIAVIVYFVYAYRRKRDEKEAYTHSMSTIIPSGESTKGGSSVHSSHFTTNSYHSSKHSTHSSYHPSVQSYPAFRSTISEKKGQCNSIDTKSYDSDQVSDKPQPIKNVKHEFDSMRRGLQKDKYRQAMEEEELKHQERRRQEAQKADREGRAESNRGLGRRSRSKERQPILTDEAIRQSLRAARDKGRNFDDRDSGRGTTRSKPRPQSTSSSKGYRELKTDSDYFSDDKYYRERDRDRSRNRNDSQRPRSSSVGSRRRRDRDDRSDYSDYDDRRSRSGHHSSHHTTSHRRRDYDERSDYSDYDDRRRHARSSSRSRTNNDHRSRRDSLTQRSGGQRSGTQRSRSQSASRRQR